MDPLRVTPRLLIPAEALSERFIAAAGPGGQNVNKVATAVQLRFDPALAPGLGAAARTRLAVLAGRRMAGDGVVMIAASQFRTQERNRADARERLAALLLAACQAPVKRVRTRPTLGSKERRLAAKTVRAGVKRSRARPGEE